MEIVIAEMTLTGWIDAVGNNKIDPVAEGKAESWREYNSFVINRVLSYHPDGVHFANIMNRSHGLDNDMQFAFLRGSLRSRRRRYIEWGRVVNDDAVKAVSRVYKMSRRRAEETVAVLTEDQLNAVIALADEGGRK